MQKQEFDFTVLLEELKTCQRQFKALSELHSFKTHAWDTLLIIQGTLGDAAKRVQAVIDKAKEGTA